MNKKLILPKKMNPELAEETGLHFGDGSMNFYNGKGLYQLRGHMHDDKEHYLIRVKPIYKGLFNIDVNIRDMPSTGVCGFQIWSDNLVSYKNKILNLPLGNKIDFEIPPLIIKNENFFKSFLRGYFDTDGCLYIENKRGKPYPRIELASVSNKFILQLKENLIKLGFKLSYYITNREKYGWNDLHRISIKGHYMVDKWFVDIKPNNPKHLKKFYSLKK